MTARAPLPIFNRHSLIALGREYAVVIVIVVVMIAMSFLSDVFLTRQNLLNIVNQSTPLALIATALTLVIISGNFDLSTGAMFGACACVSAWVAVHVDPTLGLLVTLPLGMVFGAVNGLVITTFKVHSFLATLASGLVFRGIAVLITGGFMIPVRMEAFTWLGRGKVGVFNIAVLVLIAFVAAMTFLLNRTTFGRRIYAIGGNEEAAILSGIRTNAVKIAAFALTGFAAGLAAAVATSRISVGQPQAGQGMELDAIAAVILGGNSVYGGVGAVWRSVAGLFLLALIGNAFNLLNVDPFYKDVTTGLIIIVAVALSGGRDHKQS